MSFFLHHTCVYVYTRVRAYINIYARKTFPNSICAIGLNLGKLPHVDRQKTERYNPNETESNFLLI